MSYNYGNNCYSNDYDRKCNCRTFFKDISRGEEVKVYFKGGGNVRGEFISIRGDIVMLVDSRESKYHQDNHQDHQCKDDKVKITTICCDDIVAVKV